MLRMDSGLQRSRRARLPGNDRGAIRVHPLTQLLKHQVKLGRRAGRPQLRRTQSALLKWRCISAGEHLLS